MAVKTLMICASVQRTAVTEVDIVKVKELMPENRYYSLREVAQELSITRISWYDFGQYFEGEMRRSRACSKRTKQQSRKKAIK
ncbi:hypothetical protein QE152_g2015 [Popillia japonica]|uniref:Uncharacterized protein n=1 Tax=Popillia japonica TaxID=7064 RepID=A0AAW1N2M9_POPJA